MEFNERNKMINGNQKLEGKKIETTTYMFPINSNIKLTAKGRYYKGSSRGGRFFPLKKSDFLKLDLSNFSVWQEIGPEWIKIN